MQIVIHARKWLRLIEWIIIWQSVWFSIGEFQIDSLYLTIRSSIWLSDAVANLSDGLLEIHFLHFSWERIFKIQFCEHRFERFEDAFIGLQSIFGRLNMAIWQFKIWNSDFEWINIVQQVSWKLFALSVSHFRLHTFGPLSKFDVFKLFEFERLRSSGTSKCFEGLEIQPFFMWRFQLKISMENSKVLPFKTFEISICLISIIHCLFDWNFCF